MPTQPIRWSNVFWFLIRIYLGLLYAYAGFTKVIEPIENFRGLIAQYEVLAYPWVPVLAHILPWVELLSGVFLVLGYVPRISALILSLLSLSFVVLINLSYVKTGHLPADCGCFGEGSLIHFTGRQILLVDSLNFGLGLKLFSSRDFPWSLDKLLSSHQG